VIGGRVSPPGPVNHRLSGTGFELVQRAREPGHAFPADKKDEAL